MCRYCVIQLLNFANPPIDQLNAKFQSSFFYLDHDGESDLVCLSPKGVQALVLAVVAVYHGHLGRLHDDLGC